MASESGSGPRLRRLLVSVMLMEQMKRDQQLSDRVLAGFTGVQIDEGPTSRAENYGTPFYEGTFLHCLCPSCRLVMKTDAS